MASNTFQAWGNIVARGEDHSMHYYYVEYRLNREIANQAVDRHSLQQKSSAARRGSIIAIQDQ
jgi:hypothetical protein